MTELYSGDPQLEFIPRFLFALGKQALKNTTEIKLRQMENNQYKNAWKYMYNKENRQGKRKMDDAWQNSWEQKFNQ